jgi:tetratricopeptide (TPR) repeat protein
MMNLMEKRVSPIEYVRELLANSIRFGKENMHGYGLNFALRALEVKKKHVNIAIPISFIYLRISLHYDALGEYNRSVLYLRLSMMESQGKKLDDGKVNYEEDLMIMLANNLARNSVKRFSEAGILCDQLIKKNPEGESPYYIKGLIEFQTGNPDKAIHYYTEAIARNKTQYIYYFYRAIVFNSQKKYPEAEKDLLKVLSLKTDFPEALNFLGFMYAEQGQRLKESHELISKAVDHFPLNGSYQDSLGWVLYRMGRMQEALFHLELAAQILEEEGKSDPEVYGHLGDVLLELQYPAKARSNYQKSIELIEKNMQNEKDLFNKNMNELKKELEKKILNLESSYRHE